jgi:hypothetical protein
VELERVRVDPLLDPDEAVLLVDRTELVVPVVGRLRPGRTGE